MKKKPSLVQVIEPPLCPYWRYDSDMGSVVIYSKRGSKLTISNGNYMLDIAKNALLNGHGVQDS